MSGTSKMKTTYFGNARTRPMTALSTTTGKNFSRLESGKLGSNTGINFGSTNGGGRLSSAMSNKEQFNMKVQQGYYVDLNVSGDEKIVEERNNDSVNDHIKVYKYEDSDESSVEIAEDEDQLDENQDKFLADIEKNPKIHYPDFIEVGQLKRPRTVTSTFNKPKPLNGSFENIPLEREIALQKIRHVEERTKIHHEDKMENLHTKTLSVYGRPHTATNFKIPGSQLNGSRPFSAMLHNETLNNERSGQMREVEDIKNRLTRYKVNFSG